LVDSYAADGLAFVFTEVKARDQHALQCLGTKRSGESKMSMCHRLTACVVFCSHGRSGAAMSAAAFCLLVLNVLGTPKPKFAQLTSSVFGLFYCGKHTHAVKLWSQQANTKQKGEYGRHSQASTCACVFAALDTPRRGLQPSTVARMQQQDGHMPKFLHLCKHLWQGLGLGVAALWFVHLASSHHHHHHQVPIRQLAH
jgi:hypothetical protein